MKVRNILLGSILVLSSISVFAFRQSKEAEITEAATPSNYYSSITSSMKGDALKVALYNIIKGHNKRDYDTLEVDMAYTDRNWSKSSEKTSENPYMVLLYADYNETNAQLWNTSHGSYGTTDNNAAVWNKEHIWAKSNGFNTKSLPAYSDLHHLRASDKQLNGTRSNYAFANTSSGSYAKDHFGNSSTSRLSGGVFEPGDQYKGDVARALFYMATRYYNGDGSGGTHLTLTTGTDSSGGKWGYLDTLLEWHEQDPVDEFESHRNDLVYELQNNRNPYIDHPEYARAVFKDEAIVEPKKLTSLTYTGTPIKTSYKEGESFSSSGLTVTAHYDDSTSENVTNSVIWSPNPLTKDTNSVTGSYTYNNVTMEINVNGISVITLDSLTYTGSPTKTAYTAGESFSPSGLSVYANYSDSSSVNVTSQVSWTPNPLIKGTVQVTGTYGGKSITVSGITVTAPATTEYQITFSDSSSDSSSELDADGIKNKISEGASYVVSVSNNSKVYAGKTGLKLGSSSAKGTFTLNLASTGKVNATSIKIGVKQYGSDTGNVKVTTNVDASTTQVTPTSSLAEKEISLSGGLISKITVETTTKRAYISYIKVISNSGEEDVVQNWIDSYMHMSDSAYDGNGTGLCKSSGTYLTAKIALVSLGTENVNKFANNEGNKYTLALARYLAWANANEDNSPFSGTTIDSLYQPESTANGTLMIVIIASSVVTTLLFGCILLFKKKKTCK